MRDGRRLDGHETGLTHVRGTNHDEDDGMNETQIPAMTEQEVARRLSLSVATLRSWRLRRRGPRYVRFGRAVRYLASDVDRFVRACAVEHRGVPDQALAAIEDGQAE